MADSVTILTTSLRMAKLWKCDGTIEPYAFAKHFHVGVHNGLGSIEDLSGVLTALESQSGSCIIRGEYRGEAWAKETDIEHKAGRPRRTSSNFVDVSRFYCMIDVDGFESLLVDPLMDPGVVIAEFIETKMPLCFQGVSYHWQLSNSMGHPSKTGLRVHLWFWLTEARTSAELHDWVSESGVPVDRSVMNPVHIHYTANPCFEDGVADPVLVRSGFTPGLVSGSVLVPRVELGGESGESGESGAKGNRQQKVKGAGENDPVARRLEDLGLVKGIGKEGQLWITCPFAEEHTGESGLTTTVYFPNFTGGYRQGHFKCQHDHCSARKRPEFLKRIEYEEGAEDFENLSQDPPPPPDGTFKPTGDAPAPKPAPKPTAIHLCTEQANSDRLVARFHNRLMWCGSRWYIWSGTHWQVDSGDVVQRYGMHLSRLIKAEAEGYRVVAEAWRKKGNKEKAEAADGIADGLLKWGTRSESRACIMNSIELVKSQLVRDPGLLNRDPWVLNVTNGTLDLRTGTLRPHNPDDYITLLAPTVYDPVASVVMWEKVVGQIFAGDAEMMDFMRRQVGYCATGLTREQVMFFHIAPGENGKSLMTQAITDVMGDYAGPAAPGMFTGDKERHTTEIVDMEGKRYVTAFESDEGAMLRQSLIKNMTGEKSISARQMHKNARLIKLVCKLNMQSNHRPVIRGQDHGIWRRVVLIEYPVRFGTAAEVAAEVAQAVRDSCLDEKLADERSGILNWIVQGAGEYYRGGLSLPESVLRAVGEYRDEQDKVKQFLNECCEIGPDFEEVLTGGFDGGMYTAWVWWCKKINAHPIGVVKFIQEITRLVKDVKIIRGGKEKDGLKRRNVIKIYGIRLFQE